MKSDANARDQCQNGTAVQHSQLRVSTRVTYSSSFGKEYPTPSFSVTARTSVPSPVVLMAHEEALTDAYLLSV